LGWDCTVGSLKTPKLKEIIIEISDEELIALVIIVALLVASVIKMIYLALI